MELECLFSQSDEGMSFEGLESLVEGFAPILDE